jgi:hypothetical protein
MASETKGDSTRNIQEAAVSTKERGALLNQVENRRRDGFIFGRWKRRKVRKRRSEVLSTIGIERSVFEAMKLRAERAGDTTDRAFVTEIFNQFDEIADRAVKATTVDELDDLVAAAERKGQFRAYLCPAIEVVDEGNMTINLMEEWNVPRVVTDTLRRSLGEKLKDKDIKTARGALRALFDERDSWAAYTDEYEDAMQSYAWKLLGAILILSTAAVVLYHWARWFPLGLLLAGAAGSCASVISKLPVLDVSLSGELDAYSRRILSRIGTGTVASLVGCGLLAWGLLPVSIQNLTFSDIINACTGTCGEPCTVGKTMILLAVPMLFGFSERTLTSFERTVLGDSSVGHKRSRNHRT